MASHGPPSQQFPPPASQFPASMGPGAQPMQPGQTPADALRRIQEMRAQYSVNIEPTTLNLGYEINGKHRSFQLPFDSMPLTGFSKWLLYGGSGRGLVAGTFLLDLMRGAENMTGHPLTQKEAEGFAYHTSKRMRYSFAGTALALGGGYGFAFYTRKTMKFPFRPVKPLEAYDVFPSKRLTLLPGQYARVAWQLTRFNVYASLALIFLSPLFRGMGESVMTVGLYRDERTRAVVKEMKGSVDRIRMNRSAGQQQQGPILQAQQSSEESTSQDFYDKNEQSYYGKSNDYSGDNTFSDDTTDSGTMSDAAIQSRESRQSSPASYGASQYSQAQRPDTTTKTSNSDFFFDDASPTAGNPPDTATPGYSQTSGSTWDRIRRGGPSSGQPRPSSMPSPTSSSNTTRPMQETRGWRQQSAQSGQDFETKGDSFSFSSSDQQRALAKDQAQREFDEMLERERQEGEAGSEKSSSWSRRRS